MFKKVGIHPTPQGIDASRQLLATFGARVSADILLRINSVPGSGGGSTQPYTPPTSTEPESTSASPFLNELLASTTYYATETGKIVIELPGIKLTMPANTFVDVDLDNDGVDDVRVTTGSIVNGKADVTITEIEVKEEVQAAIEEIAPVETETTPEPEEAPEQTKPVEEPTKTAFTWLYLLASALILGILIFVVVRKK